LSVGQSESSEADALRAALTSLILAPRDVIEAIGDPSESGYDLAVTMAGFLCYTAAIRLLFSWSQFARTDDDWIGLAQGQLILGEISGARSALRNVTSRGIEFVRARSLASLLIGDYDDAIKARRLLYELEGKSSDEPDPYVDLAFQLLIPSASADRRRDYATYWLGLNVSQDALVAYALAPWIALRGDTVDELLSDVPQRRLPLTRTMFAFPLLRDEQQRDAFIDRLERVVGKEYRKLMDELLRNLLSVISIDIGVLESEEDLSDWIIPIIDEVSGLSRQERSALYGHTEFTLGLLRGIAGDFSSEPLLLKLKETLLDHMDASDVKMLSRFETPARRYVARFRPPAD
jgi:hypothetical protein